MRRGSALVLTAFYLLQASWILQGGVDVLFPRTRLVKAGESACCTSGCGCPSEAQERKACCCYPKKESGPAPVASAPVPVPVSTLEEDHCRGTDGSMAGLLSAPALPGPAPLAPDFLVASILETVHPEPRLPHFDRSWDKVPL